MLLETKVVLLHAMEAYNGGGGRDIAPLIFNLDAGWT
jgi:hypothetical protein